MKFTAKIAYRFKDEFVFDEGPIWIKSESAAKLISHGAVTMLQDYPNIDKVVVVLERL